MMMGNTVSLKRVELAPSELMVEVAHNELLEVAFHKLIEVAHFELTLHIHNQSSFLVFKKQLAPFGIPSFC